MKFSLGISNFLEEISSLSHSIVYFFALITEEGFFISPCYSLELCIKMGISFLFSFAFQLSSVQSLSCVWLFATPWITARQASLSSLTLGVHSDSWPLSQWCHPAISSSVIPFSSCTQSLPVSESSQWVNFSHEVAKALEFQLQHQFF